MPVSLSERTASDPQSGLSRTKALALALLCAGGVLAAGVVHGQVSSVRAPAVGTLTRDAAPGYAGSTACAGCHAVEGAAWAKSQHARAMQPATTGSVLGNFGETRAEHFGSQARFSSKDGAFFVQTEGKDGKSADFAVDYTFGVEPLQQYLTTLPDGRMQVLPYAWDTRTKDAGGQRWIHLYPDEAIPPGDALHWTGAQQNWNFMCADCHSTAVRKGYDAAANRFSTTYSEISVGCESCHGPGAGHVAWAKGGRSGDLSTKGFASVAAKRPAPDWTPDPATGSPAHGVSRPVGDEVETCGTCHSRRGQFAEGWQPGKPLADFYRPSFLTPDLFEADGQMRDEVFNYASFLQSKMHAKGVVCSDCHDPHGGKLKADGSEVCSQCHMPQKFAAAGHTGHATGAGQPDCVSCHMPSRTYMVVDPRHDHGFRIPRPDLSMSLGTPNACNDCHRDKPAAWAAGAVERWHGPVRKGGQTYAAAFHAAASGQPEARALLLQVAKDSQAPAIARGTALLMLENRPSVEVEAAMVRGLSDPDPMVRVAALGGLRTLPQEQRWRRGSAGLVDPVRAVRLQAAVTLAEGPPATASDAERRAFAGAAAEYVAAERFNADRAESRSNLGQFFARQGRMAEAEQEYLAALNLAFAVAPRVDLADLYRTLGREAEAELLLRQTISIDPRAAGPRHALGLALIRAKRYPEALEALRRASELEPTQPRYAYVYAVALESTGRAAEAAGILEKALEASPSDMQVLGKLLQSAMRAGDIGRALPLADRLRMLLPDDPSVGQLAGQLKAAAGKLAPK
ncbi:MAG: Tetratricopeptide 2 repeat protein [Hyphomicrobiales bacterium]|nr:Tetratricopeptide 2 repeat protein [Hyphomicrobiales bacterium]